VLRLAGDGARAVIAAGQDGHTPATGLVFTDRRVVNAVPIAVPVLCPLLRLT
jgi:hypothetical protein